MFDSQFNQIHLIQLIQIFKSELSLYHYDASNPIETYSSTIFYMSQKRAANSPSKMRH